MRILLINQFYCPDPAATGQLMADQAEELSRRGHEVHVLCSARAYGGGSERYPPHEVFQGVHVHRVGTTGFGRGSIIGRLTDYLFFYIFAAVRALFLPRMDVCVCLTTPPFIGVVGAMLRAVKGTQLVLWVMDVYPQIAVTFGVIGPKSLINRVLWRVSRALYRRASRIISLGEFMTQRLVEAGADPDKIVTVHNWVPREVVVPKPSEQSQTREGWGLNGESTVMYSGNLGLGHDLSTFVKAATHLQKDLDFRMLFVGKGNGLAPLRKLCEEEEAECVAFHPPQSLECLADSLAAGDIHLVSQKPGTQGLIVPCKIYGVLAAGRPVIFVGPEDCEPAQIIRASGSGRVVAPGDIESAAQALRQLLVDPDLRKAMGNRAREYYENRLGRARSVAASAEAIEGVCPETATTKSSVVSSPVFRRRCLRLAVILAAPLMLLSLVVWGAEIGSFAAAPFLALWEGGLAAAVRNYSSSGTFWALLGGSFVLTACLTPLAMVVARRIGAVDRGGHRKVSQKTMPLLGGIAVALPFLAVCGLGILGATDLLSTITGMRAQLWAILIGGLCILGVGIMDDTRGMRIRHKFFSEAAIALFLCFCGFSVQSVTLPLLGTIHFGVLLGAILTILWIVGLTNALNIIDGLDGLASGIALIAALGLGFIAAINGAVFVVLLCTALAGSLAAFLLFNFHPARIFLGDTGSLFLGFTLAAISLTASMKMAGTVIFLAPMLALGLPLFEVTLSMFRRYMRGLPIYCADAGHIHHRLLKRGFSQRRVALILYAAGIMCLLAALFTCTASTKTSALLFPLGLYAAAMLTIGWLAGYTRDLGESLEIRRRNVFYQAFVNFVTMGLSSDVDVLGVNSILEIARKEMRLAYLSASFLDPAQSIGISGTIRQSDNGSSPGPVKELRVKSTCGQHILIRYQHDGEAEKRIRDEVETHLGRIFEQSTINRSTLRMDAEPIRLEEHDAPPAREHDAPPAREHDAPPAKDASRRPVRQTVSTLQEMPVGAGNSPN